MFSQLVRTMRSVGARRVGAAFGTRRCPSHVSGAGVVTRLAAHVEIGPACRIRIGGEVVVFLQITGVAVGALVAPGLVAADPAQWIAGPERLAGVELEPALATLVLWLAVPGNAERLQ